MYFSNLRTQLMEIDLQNYDFSVDCKCQMQNMPTFRSIILDSILPMYVNLSYHYYQWKIMLNHHLAYPRLRLSHAYTQKKLFNLSSKTMQQLFLKPTINQTHFSQLLKTVAVCQIYTFIRL